MSQISELTPPVKSFLFRNVTGSRIKKFILDHEGEVFEKYVVIDPDGSDITIETDDNCWTRATKTWLKTENGDLIGTGFPVRGENITYLVNHE